MELGQASGDVPRRRVQIASRQKRQTDGQKPSPRESCCLLRIDIGTSRAPRALAEQVSNERLRGVEMKSLSMAGHPEGGVGLEHRGRLNDLCGGMSCHQ